MVEDPTSHDGSPDPMDTPLHSKRTLVAITKPEAALRAIGPTLAASADFDASALSRTLAEAGARMRPLFGESEDRVRAKVATLAASAPDGTTRPQLPALDLFYAVEAPEDRLDALAASLARLPGMAGAYVTPPPQPASELLDRPRSRRGEGVNRMAAMPQEAPPATPDFVARQGYLGPAPGGIDAVFAWTLPGGRGADVQVIDCEGAWRLTHEDLRLNQGGVIGTETTDAGWRNHGTAVGGEIGADPNAFGVTGIASDANFRGSSIFVTGGVAAAIVAAADRLRPGDIILLEVQYDHPNRGYTAVEWWPADYAAIRYAVDRGVIVVEAAANGANDLDDAIYDTPLPGFPADWRNPFRRTERDSGAILVGAGAPPPGTHGRDWGPDRSRLDFSNYGSAVDVQGWGREVTTCGYGDLQGGNSEDLWYTDGFSGTSSASPIVVGALACVQGILRARGRTPLSPARARQLLRATGSPQQDAPGRPVAQRIGNRPNLRPLIVAALLPELVPARSLPQGNGVQFTGVVAAKATQRWYTHGWPAHWHVQWTVVPTGPKPGTPQLRWTVEVERASDRAITYWISVTNLTADPVAVEARYAVLGR